MKLELFQTKLKVIKARYNHNMAPLIELGKCFIGLDAIIPKGEYRGRWGKITQVIIDADGDVCGIIMPYRMIGNTNDLILDSRPDARTYWRLYEVTAIKIEDTNSTPFKIDQIKKASETLLNLGKKEK